jgi:hypothetical protein
MAFDSESTADHIIWSLPLISIKISLCPYYFMFMILLFTIPGTIPKTIPDQVIWSLPLMSVKISWCRSDFMSIILIKLGFRGCRVTDSIGTLHPIILSGHFLHQPLWLNCEVRGCYALVVDIREAGSVREAMDHTVRMAALSLPWNRMCVAHSVRTLNL